MTKTSILIPDGESTLTWHVVLCLSFDKNIEINVLSKDPNASIKHSRFIHSFQTYDFELISSEPDFKKSGDKVIDELIKFHHYDDEKSGELISEIIKHLKLTNSQILFPVDEHIVKILSAHKDKFNNTVLLAPFPDHDVFTMAINKWRLSEFLKKNNVPHPATIRYHKGISMEIIREIKLPVIIKPIDQGNAQGIRSFHNSEDLLSFFGSQKLQHEYIIQPFINGYDIDCSVLCSRGNVLAYTIQKGIAWSKNRYQAAVGIEFLFEKEVLSVVERLMKLLNWSGVAHIDLRYDQDQKEVKVIEINARYWGSLLGSLNAGVNFPLLACKSIKGESIERTEYKFVHYFMGKSPIYKIVTSAFRSGREKIRLRETSLYYTLKDPMPFFIEVFYRFLRKLGLSE